MKVAGGIVWLLMVACQTPPEPPVAPDPIPAEAPPEPRAETRYDRELKAATDFVHRYQAEVDATPGNASAKIRLGRAHLTRQRLLGGTESIDAALALTEGLPAGEKAALYTAGVYQSVHRFQEAKDLIQPLPDGRQKAEQLAAIDFELGNYAENLATMERIADGDARPKPTTMVRMAVMKWRLGRFDEAEADIAKAQKNYHNPTTRWPAAWYHLLLGLMDLERERFDEALVHYRAAEAELDGWWLIEEHIAEILLEQGKVDEAIALYEPVVERTGSPELMGALADAYDASGATERAKKTRARAKAAFDAQVVSHPTMASGHALEFYLEHGSPAEALRLAESNVVLRPNGEAKLLLAEALEKNGRADEAAALRQEVEASGWWMGPGH